MHTREIIICICLIAVACVRYLFFLPAPLPYGAFVNKSVTFVGLVSEYPDIRLNNQRITVTPSGYESNILVIVPKDQYIFYGDEVRVKGILSTPENFITNTGKEFNYERYLHNQDIYFIVDKGDVEIISKNNGSWLIYKLYKLKEVFMKNIGSVISSPNSDLANGLILGARGGFDTETKNEFISTGTIHIIALSGYNVTIVAESVMKMLGTVFSMMLSLWIGILMIILFVLMAGASATAIRAGIMAVIALVARMTGRTYMAGRALVIAGLLMIAYDPRVITDISFQLSFLATIGILFVTPKVIGWVRFAPTQFKIREVIATTISATIMVLPLLLYSTGILSIVSLPANVLILPLIPLTMLASFMTGLFGFVSYSITLPFGFIAHLLLSYILGIIHFFASLPFASVTIKQFPLIGTIILYILIFYWVFRKNHKYLIKKEIE
ncbi:ComEC/Rec2 family competence protein [Candidatus Nomurabacteria bacterium]|nr:ComEC/Rec2 family competence protein [Candidatus Nomurabacteria bacterium]